MSTTTLPCPNGFVLVSPAQFATPIRIDWERTEELYRDAYELARAVVEPPITNRLTPYWN